VALRASQQRALIAGLSQANSEHADHREGVVGNAGIAANKATVHLNAHSTKRSLAAHGLPALSGCRPRRRRHLPTLLKHSRSSTLPRFRIRPNSHHHSQELERPLWPPAD
jgi:hypothetical protein